MGRTRMKPSGMQVTLGTDPLEKKTSESIRSMQHSKGLVRLGQRGRREGEVEASPRRRKWVISEGEKASRFWKLEDKARVKATKMKAVALGKLGERMWRKRGAR